MRAAVPAFPPTEEFLPVEPLTIAGLAKAAQECRGCPLYQRATQAVFGEGPATARIMFVGEQPGDAEDKQGRPFVGPAGRIFDKALAEVGLDRTRVKAELEVIKPDVLVLLGATAVQAVLGPTFRVMRDRGKPLVSPLAPVVVATAHPSSILRAPDAAARKEAYRAFVADLRVVAAALPRRRSRPATASAAAARPAERPRAGAR